KTEGAYVVVVGASNVVGKPVSQLLLNAKDTVTTCHRFKTDLKSHTTKSDILIVSVVKPHFITADMVNYGDEVNDDGIKT
ncbi:bifunctional methylenetetrahydrofolate dehydrogenase/methenyltetrahydrofolate cyclohydrolase, partial [Francisella tularensis subsp. holarctica]|nr:bifunctional methylenetetrahydrofolate dehydrogenase/methenyltetrahydrofolate cyclohydrolase [Francisella tularensis subsp. holarctica]